MRHTILFDLDDTLLDRDATIRQFVRVQYHRMGLNHLPYEAYCSRFVELDASGYTPRTTVFAALRDEFALPATTDTLVQDFTDHAWQQCILFEDTLTVLAFFKAHGWLIGIITNGSKISQRAKINASGLASCLDLILISGETGIAKPDKAIYQLAADQLGVEAQDCVFVGDNPATDVLGARQAGMLSVWLRRHIEWPELFNWQPDYTISELGELQSLPLASSPLTG